MTSLSLLFDSLRPYCGGACSRACAQLQLHLQSLQCAGAENCSHYGAQERQEAAGEAPATSCAPGCGVRRGTAGPDRGAGHRSAVWRTDGRQLGNYHTFLLWFLKLESCLKSGSRSVQPEEREDDFLNTGKETSGRTCWFLYSW